MHSKLMPQNMGKKLKAIRLHLGLTQNQLAEVIGKKEPSRRSRIHEWETGKRQPDFISLLAYARLVGITTDILIDDEQELKLNNADQKEEM